MTSGGKRRRCTLTLAATLAATALSAAPAQAGLLSSVTKVVNTVTATATTTLNTVAATPAVTTLVGNPLVAPIASSPTVTALASGKIGTTLESVACPTTTVLDSTLGSLSLAVPGLLNLGTSAPSLGALTGPVKTVSCMLSALDYGYRVESPKPGGGTLVQYIPATVEVPALLDADGDGTPDLQARISVLASGLTDLKVEINRLSTADAGAALPVRVEALVPDPTKGGLPRGFLAYGYDALESGAPAQWQTAVHIGDVSDATDPRIGVDITSAGTRGPVSVLADLFNSGSDLQRRDELGGILRFAPVPASVAAVVHLGDVLTATVDTSQQTRLDIAVRQGQGNSEQRVAASIDQAPLKLLMRFGSTPEGYLTADYEASSRIATLRAEATQRSGWPSFSTVVSRRAVTVRGLPVGVHLRQRSLERFSAWTDGGAVGAIEGDMTEGGPPVTAPPTGNFVKAFQETGYTSAAFRILGFESVDIDAGENLKVDGRLQRGLFTGDVHTPDLDASLSIHDLPGHVTFELRPGSATEPAHVIFDGNGEGVQEIAVDVNSAQRLFGKATRLRLTLSDVPALWDLTLDRPDDGGFRAQANAPIGAVEVLATSGPGATLPAGQQGAILRDRPDAFIAFARLFNAFREVSIQSNPQRVRVRTGGGEPFRLLATTTVQHVAAAPTLGDFNAFVSNVPQDLSFSSGGNDVIDLQTSERIQQVTFEGRGLELLGRPAFVRATVEGLPDRLQVDQSGGGLDVRAAQPVGLLQLQVTDREFDYAELPADRDGLIYQDLPERLRLTAKIRNLQRVAILSNPTKVIVENPDPQPIRFDFQTPALKLITEVLGLPTRMQYTLNNGKKLLDVDSSGPIQQITVNGEMQGGLSMSGLTLSNVPAQMTLCLDNGPACARPELWLPGGWTWTKLSVDFTQHGNPGNVLLNGKFCLNASQAQCDSGQPPKPWVLFDNLSWNNINIGFEQKQHSDDESEYYIGLDTDDTRIGGRITYYADNGLELAGIQAQDWVYRIFVEADVFSPRLQYGAVHGSLSCWGLDVVIHDIPIISPFDIAGFLC